jgi:hypothetical protein
MTLRITVEVLPGGNEQTKFEVGRVEMYNVSDLSDISDYAVWGKDAHAEVRTHLHRYKRSAGWARLLRAAMDQILKDFPRFAEYQQ